MKRYNTAYGLAVSNYLALNLHGKLSDLVNGQMHYSWVNVGQNNGNVSAIMAETLKVFTGMTFITLSPLCANAVMLMVHC